MEIATDVRGLFDSAAQVYDRNRPQLIPDFGGFYGVALKRIPFTRDEAFGMLDLGAGTGLLAGMVAKAFPNARLTLVDVAPHMLERARERLASRAGTRFVVSDFVAEPLDGSYDIVMSALALHHTEQHALKSVFSKVLDVLVPGGIFINADQTLGASPAIESAYANEWLQHAHAAGCTSEEIEQAHHRMTADRTATLLAQLTWMREAGFEAVDCWYKNHRFAVMTGVKR